MAFKANEPVRTKIIISHQFMEQVYNFNYLKNYIVCDKNYVIDT